MPKSYSRYPCRWCGKVVSVNGLASTSHFRACKVRLEEERQHDEAWRKKIEETIRLNDAREAERREHE